MDRDERTVHSGCGVLFLALGLSLFSFLFFSRVDSWDELGTVCGINFLVIGTLWAFGASIWFRGKRRIVTILAWIVPASALSLFQAAVTKARFTPSPGGVTLNEMRYTASRIQTYMEKHRQAPPTLSDLSRDGSSETPVDGWGHEIQYSVDRDGVITLTSFGADGKPDGRDADVVESYRTRNKDGTLNVDDEEWMSKARIEAPVGNDRVGW
jgi:hypothetical protein